MRYACDDQINRDRYLLILINNLIHTNTQTEEQLAQQQQPIQTKKKKQAAEFKYDHDNLQ